METKQKLNQLKAVVDSVIEAVENRYYTAEDLTIGNINYMEIREWAEMEPEEDCLTTDQILENRMIEDVCYLVRQQLL